VGAQKVPTTCSYKMSMPRAFQSYTPKHMRVYGSICINGKGEVLLVHGRRSGLWSFPKGHCKYGENDIECARRETREETGIELKVSHTSYHKLRVAGYFVFTVEDCAVPVVSPDNWEIDKVAWWPLCSLPLTNSNVDVSIFRTVMKNWCEKDKDATDYLDSPEARTKVSTICNSIRANSLAKC